MKRVLLVAVLLGAVAAFTVPAFAHATLESTNPPTGEVVAKSPGQVVLHFDEQVAVSAQSVEVYNASAHRVDAGTARHVPGDSHSVEVGVPSDLAAGGYVVTWRVISADSHPVHGAFTFFVGSSGAGAAVGDEAAQLLSKTGGSQVVGVAFGVIRFVGFLGVALLLGAALFLAAIWSDRRVRRLLIAGLVLAATATIFGFLVQGVYGAGLPISQLLKGSLVRGTWDTRFGKAQLARLVLLAVFVAVARRTWKVPTLLCGAALLATWGLADHASTGAWVWLALPFDVVHLGAAGLWIGGLVVIVLAVLPASRQAPSGRANPLRIAMPRFSQWALGAVVAIGASGLFAAWRQITISWGALTDTPYGRLVVAKTALFVALLAIASISRRAVHGRLAIPWVTKPAAARREPAAVTAGPATISDGPGAMAADPDRAIGLRLGRLVGVEVAVGLAVLALTSWLVEAQPASQAYGAPFSTQVTAGPDFVNAVVEPAKAGPMVIHMYILNHDGAQVSVPEVDATMSNAGAGVSGLGVPLHEAGPGHFLTTGFVLPLRGTWKLQVIVRTDAIDEYYAQVITVHVR